MSPRPYAALVAAAAVALAACSGGTPAARPSASGPSVVISKPPTSASPSASPKPSAKPSAKPSPSKSASPSPSPTPKPTGAPVTSANSALAYTPDATAIPAGPDADCTTIYPELYDISCDVVRLDGGTLMWVAGTDAGRWTLRLLTFAQGAGGYVQRFQAVDPDGSWTGFRLGTTSLTNNGTDSVVAATLHAGPRAERSYDVLTWRKGGPLVLRAHRAKLPQGRVVLGPLRVDEYAAVYSAGEQPCCPARFIYRRLAWDGTRFVLATVGAAAASRVPPAE